MTSPSPQSSSQALLNAIGDSLMLLHIDGRIVGLNHAAAALLKQPAENLIGASGADCLPPISAGRLCAKLSQVVLERQPVWYEDEQDGEWYRHWLYPVLDEAGAVVQVALHSRVVTSARHAAEAMREGEERFRFVTLATLDAVYDWDILADTSWRNDRYYQQYAPPDTSYGWWRDAIHPDDRESVETGLRQALDGQDAHWQREYRFRRADGSYAHVVDRSFIIRGEDGRAMRMIGAMTDVTDARHAEERLRREALVFENMYDAVLITDAEGRITDWNAAAVRLFGYEREEILGKHPETLNPKEDGPALTRAIRQNLDAGREWRGEVRFRTRSGRIGYCEVAVVPLLDECGQHRAAISVNRDITQRREAEREILRLQQDLARVSRLRSLGELAGMLIHALDQPLTSIANFAYRCGESIEKESLDTEDLKRLTRRIEDNASTAIETVHRMRDFVRHHRLDRSSVSAAELVEEVVRLMEGESARRGVSIAVETEPGLPAVSADRIHIEHVLANLVQNAVDAVSDCGPAGGTVAIHTRPHGDAFVEVIISDSGPGLSAEVLDRALAQLYSSKPQGLGMGLSISQKLVQAHGGRLWVTSNEPNGTRVHFTVPVVSAD